MGSLPFSFGSAVFQVLGVVQPAPFTPSFGATNMVPGQNVAMTFHATAMQGGPVYVPAATVTLLPQVVDATVTGVSTSGPFAVYTVSLAPYEPLASLAVQAGQAGLLHSPPTMTVYLRPDAQQFTTTQPAVGGTVRFRGLVYNDGGALKMDATEVLDGVAE